MHNFKIVARKISVIIVIFLMLNFLLSLMCQFRPSHNIGLEEIQTTTVNPDVVFIGSSIAYTSYVPKILKEQLKKKVICLGSGNQCMPSVLTVTEELFECKNPKQIVLSVDHWTFFDKSPEPISASEIIYPGLKNLKDKFKLLARASYNDNCFARLLKWPYFLTANPNILMINVVRNVQDAFLKNTENTNKDQTNLGSGFSVYDSLKPEGVLDYDNINRKSKQFDADASPYSVKLFAQLVKLCNENNCKLILIAPPRPSFDVLEENNYNKIDLAITKFANEHHVPYFNFIYAKPDLLDMALTDYKDYTHINSRGAEKFSYAFCQVLNEYNAGKDVSQYFYNYDEYAASIDYVTNTWFTYTLNKDYIKSKAITVKAESSYGTTITPEYQFLLVNKKTNQEQVLRDYATDCEYSFKLPDRPQDYEIKIKARPIGDDNSNNVRYSIKPILEY